MTPQVAAGLGKQPAPPPLRAPLPPPVAPAPAAPTMTQEEQLTALERLRNDGVLTDDEYDTMCRRVTGGV